MANPYAVAGFTIGGITGLTLLASWATKAKAAPSVTPDNLLNQILFSVKQKALGNDELAAKVRKNAEASARALGLTATAKALKAESALPAGENWPGTNMSVAAYVKEAIAAASNSGNNAG